MSKIIKRFNLKKVLQVVYIKQFLLTIPNCTTKFLKAQIDCKRGSKRKIIDSAKGEELSQNQSWVSFPAAFY